MTDKSEGLHSVSLKGQNTQKSILKIPGRKPSKDTLRNSKRVKFDEQVETELLKRGKAS